MTVDDVSYTVAVTARDPDNVEIFPDFPIHCKSLHLVHDDLPTVE